MQTLKKLFMYLLMVLFISIFFQSVAILFIKYTHGDNNLAVKASFDNANIITGNVNAEEKPVHGADKFLNTLSRVAYSGKTKSEPDNTPEKMTVRISQENFIEEYKPQAEASKAPAAEVPYGKKIIFHTLTYGQKLSDVAKIYSMPIDELKKINNFGSDYRIYIGQKIMVTAEAAQQTTAAATSPETFKKILEEQKAKIISSSEKNSTLDEQSEVEIKTAKKKSQKLDDEIANILKNVKTRSLKGKNNSPQLENVSTESRDPLSDIIKSAKKKRRVFKWPVRGVVTSKFGMRLHPVWGESKMHTGIDIGAGKGRPITAAMGGKVTFAGWLGGYGKLVEIKHPKGYTTRYAHMSKINVKVGQEVTSSKIVGYVGDTGTSTGYHLHFEVRKNGNPLNPLAYIQY
ncbi:MAG: M23 family metallopeptidase [Candidatus Wallbacteria bacterium]